MRKIAELHKLVNKEKVHWKLPWEGKRSAFFAVCCTSNFLLLFKTELSQ